MSDEATGAVAERYAAALFDLASERNALESVAEDLRNLKAMIAESADLRRLIGSPTIARAEQSKALLAVAERAGFGQITTNLIGLLARNRRLFYLNNVANAFLKLLAARKGEVSAEVVSAAPLTEQQMTALAASLKSAAGGNVSLAATVDPALLGGMVVKLGSRQVDGSLRTKLQRMSLAMKGVA